jgi:hypothetical protein
MLDKFDVTHEGLTFNFQEIGPPEAAPTVRVLRGWVYLAKPQTPTKVENCFGGDITFDAAWDTTDKLMKESVAVFAKHWVGIVKKEHPDLVQMV